MEIWCSWLSAFSAALLCFVFLTSKLNSAAFPYMQEDFNFATQTGLCSGI